MTRLEIAVDKDSRIFIAGHRGMLGSALIRSLTELGYQNVLTVTREALDLRDPGAVCQWFADTRPEYVINAAALVGGIRVNQARPAEFIHTNLMIITSIVDASHQHGVKRLINFGSNCAYPKFCDQPMPETSLLTGKPEPTSLAYAMSKLAGMQLCAAYNRQHGTKFLTVIPATLYGPNDNFDLESSHVLSALIRKCHEVKAGERDGLQLWGTGTPKREFLYVDDMADACLFLLQQPWASIAEAVSDRDFVMNVGSGDEWSMLDLAKCIATITECGSEPLTDPSQPDGSPRRLLDSTIVNQLGWHAQTPLQDGIRETYRWFLNQG